MKIEEMIKTILDRGCDDTIPIRFSVISQIKNRVLEIQFQLYNIALDFCNTSSKEQIDALEKERDGLNDELCWRMQDLEDVINREKLPPIDNEKEGLNYKYEDPTDVLDPKKIADEKYPVVPWTVMPKEDDNGRIINFDEWLDNYRIWIQSWNLNHGFVKGWEYAIGKSIEGKKVGDE